MSWSRRWPALAAAVLLLAPAAPGAAARSAAAPGAAGEPVTGRPGCAGTALRRVPTDRKVIALTFNAAWNEDGIARVLAVLRKERVPAMFFLTGDFADRHPEAARALAVRHPVGSHSYSHPRFPGLSFREERREAVLAARAIRRATGRTPVAFRFPYGEFTERNVRDVNALGYPVVEWVDDTAGWRGPDGGVTVDMVVRRAERAFSPGAIIQMHVGSTDARHSVLDADALPEIIASARAHGYGFAGLGRLVRRCRVRG
ncbi:polysaccharide deacetylase family protein [Streptomyces sp. UNOB3_S3]|uniref:polysaccharide deacetylase family protein n=1 Tax=Streptomyces sp. UNOB3_S3 TaxID=2871682 RepID=UPI001E5F0152|nr:polysaccharide deacetylase family protein [Streptomyces sp. UNOB3_S3]MCC3773470.1 polysaccharide deacetylase family protein [Streptomyces sp. UNOB3_S3]